MVSFMIKKTSKVYSDFVIQDIICLMFTRFFESDVARRYGDLGIESRLETIDMATNYITRIQSGIPFFGSIF